MEEKEYEKLLKFHPLFIRNHAGINFLHIGNLFYFCASSLYANRYFW
jgi:hypothetical protein